MSLFWKMAILALVFSSIGFKKYVWFISIGYGFSVAAIGAGLLILGGVGLTAGTICASILFILYGLRLGGYLAYRELRSASYNNKMKTEIKSGDGMSIAAKCAIWISAALLYVCETSPVIFRIENARGTDTVLIIGILICTAFFSGSPPWPVTLGSSTLCSAAPEDWRSGRTELTGVIRNTGLMSKRRRS